MENQVIAVTLEQIHNFEFRVRLSETVWLPLQVGG